VERRRFPRIPVSLEVSFDTGEEILSSYLFDLNEGGLFISTPNPMEVGTRMRLYFKLPHREESLDIVGTVVWRQGEDSTSKPGMGVRFDEVKEENRELFDAYILEQLGK
jgi:uncharacterized protein (TIGR02266 family)